jgi:uncharacterized membrane protein
MNSRDAAISNRQASAGTDVVSRSRIAAIDVMRGLVMVIMVMDHVRERIYLHKQVSDPMDIVTTPPELFFTRLSAHLCAPVFVFLAGLSAWLYAHPPTGFRSPTGFLFKRGLFLVFLELTVITFSWSGVYHTIWLQVIWAIGVSMIALSVIVKLEYRLIGLIGFAIVFGHNLLTPISFEPGGFVQTIWSILHERAYIVAEGPVRVKVTYPVLPWIGVIALGYFAGPLYARTTDALTRRRVLAAMGAGCLVLLLLLRGFNIYGETLPWEAGKNGIQTLMSFLNCTKYPPSLDFLLLTLGPAFLLMSWFEGMDNKFTGVLKNFGAAPMFYYIVHLYTLLVLYAILIAIFGANQGDLYGVNEIWWVWVVTLLLAIALYYPTRAFARYKHAAKNPWLRYL